ncbi:MAG: O-antigen ligase family protein [Clostridia bacterium]|nr:O-antigen ligase family protein [Clostridia bacterium]
MRVSIWRLALRMFLKAPLFGRGLLSYWFFSPEYVGQDLGFEVRVTTCAHNLLLDGLISFGAVGIALAGWYLLRILRAARARHKQGDALAVLALAALTAAAVHGLFDVTAVWPQVLLLLALVLAAATGEGTKTPALSDSSRSANAVK